MKHPLRSLFLDFDAYFASIEQQDNPALRGKPVAVSHVTVDGGTCITTSYEARAQGVCTGMSIGEAKRLCPGLRVIASREDRYVQVHRMIWETVDACVPVWKAFSIDEMACRLSGIQQQPAEGMRLARRIKERLAERIGPYIRCSIGLAPNRFLAKIASGMNKPNGLTVLKADDLPHALLMLPLRELPGLGEKMELRLARVGINTMQALWQQPMQRLRQIWGGKPGEWIWRSLHGEEPPDSVEHRYSISHSHVLMPQERGRAETFAIVKGLMARAAARLRREQFRAGGLWFYMGYDDGTWESSARFAETRDTAVFLKIIADLYDSAPRSTPHWVSIALVPLIADAQYTPSLFESGKGEKLSAAMDLLNRRFGPRAAYLASLQDSLGKTPCRIAFTRIPDSDEFAGRSNA